MTERLDDRLTASAAARALGVSYSTLKQWIYARKIRSVRTPGGHHRIARSEVARLSGGRVGAAREGLQAISGRNKLAGVVTRVRTAGLLAEVTIDIGGQSLTAIITKTSADQLKLRAGRPAIALIKATEVMVIGG
jgi:molybdopterin-binding protein